MAMAYPEAVCLRKQMAEALVGKEIAGVDVLDITKVEGSWRFGSISVKKFLHASEPGYYLSGIDSGCAIEILHRAKIHPKRTLASLSLDEQKACYRSVNVVTKEAIRKGGRSSETDLYGRPGRFVPRACKDTLGQPCTECGTAIVKFSFEGGSCYVCPECQTI